ncbi:MAG: aspartate/glutamate racemase family protein [Bacillota bacterium]
MQRIGILGGLSAESTTYYYERITRGYIRRFGKPRYPEIIIYSVTFDEYARWQERGEWDRSAEHMAACIQKLALAGADFALIASNTMHLVLPAVAARVPIPILSIVDCVAGSIRAAGLDRVALLGTIFTMTQAFYPEGLAQHGIECLVPDKRERALVNRVIYQELVRGAISDESRAAYLEVVDGLARQGAQGVIIGCTEIPLLLRQEDTFLPLFDSAAIHADAALERALGDVGLEART